MKPRQRDADVDPLRMRRALKLALGVEPHHLRQLAAGVGLTVAELQARARAVWPEGEGAAEK